MSYARGTNKQGRKIGYAVHGRCDHPGCKTFIDRGISYVCGGEHDGGEFGCGGYFCSEHLDWYFKGEDEDTVSPTLCPTCGHVYENDHSPVVVFGTGKPEPSDPPEIATTGQALRRGIITFAVIIAIAIAIIWSWAT